MNARCYENEISRIISKVSYARPSGDSFDIVSVPPGDCCFEYKKSVFQTKNWIILGIEIEIPEAGGRALDPLRKMFESMKRPPRKAASPILRNSINFSIRRSGAYRTGPVTRILTGSKKTGKARGISIIPPADPYSRTTGRWANRPER